MENFINQHTNQNWLSVKTYPIPQDKEVWTKIDDEHGERNIQRMTLKGNLWFAGSMYVYYSPTHWSY